MLTAKQLTFVTALAKGAGVSEAYRAAFDTGRMLDSSVASAATKLKALPQIQEKLAQQRERVEVVMAKQVAYSMIDAFRESEEARQLAHSVGQAGAAVAAVTLRAKLGGLLVERKEVRIGALEDTDLDELLAMRERIRDESAIDVEVVHVDQPNNRPSVRAVADQ